MHPSLNEFKYLGHWYVLRPWKRKAWGFHAEVPSGRADDLGSRGPPHPPVEVLTLPSPSSLWGPWSRVGPRAVRDTTTPSGETGDGGTPVSPCLVAGTPRA